MDDAGLRVCLQRSVELATELSFRDWPGFGRPIVHVPDPFVASELPSAIAAALAPRYRVLSLEARRDGSYQTDAADLAGFLTTFGFISPVLLAEGRGGISAVLVAAWYPAAVGRLVLIGPRTNPPCELLGLAARGLRECPPDWPALINSVRCPLLTLDNLSIDTIETFVAATEPPG